ncbi:hypothetical protein QUB05_07355 [Microcoleus sp. F10-C6]|uniref:hypothetical protein n=1 Tax=unclassified Microcoleus TaxID=2642155 RepID=UPI002FCEEDEF
MSLRYLTKIDNSGSEPSSYSFIHPSAIPYDRPALRLANRLRWDRQNIAPELERLFRYYRNTCSIAEKSQGFDYAKSAETYDEIGQRLAQMWSIKELTKVKRLNYYSRGASL